MKIGPSPRKERSPFALERLELTRAQPALRLQGSAQRLKILIEVAGDECVAFARGQATTQEIGDVFHADSSAHVLKVDRCHAAARGCEAEILELGVAVNQRAKVRGVQALIDDGSKASQFCRAQSGKLVR